MLKWLFVAVQLIATASAQQYAGMLDSLVKKHPPVFNINNIPINICFIKYSGQSVGFIVAGHAEKAVCQIASFEVAERLKAAGYTDSTVFSYGAGYDLRLGNRSSQYADLLKEMQDSFAVLAKKNPLQVRLFEVSLQEYQQKLDLIKKNFTVIKDKLNGTASVNNRFIITYKDVPFPLVVPFYTADSMIQFTIKKSSIGEIPGDVIKKARVNDLKAAGKLIQNSINSNTQTIRKIQAATDNTRPYTFTCYVISDGDIVLEKQGLGNYPSPPDDYIMRKRDKQTGRVLSESVITFQQALNALNNPAIDKRAGVRENLEAWVKLIRVYSVAFARNKADLIQELRRANTFMTAEIAAVTRYIVKLEQLDRSKDNDMAVDAFLRGWTINTHDPVMDKKLDTWYEGWRKKVWMELLKGQVSLQSKRSLSPIDDIDNIAGTFQSENVFFRVNSNGDEYIITPFQVLGGKFIQVIDKNIPVAEFYTNHNFRADEE